MTERIDHYSAAVGMLKDAQVAKDLATVAIIADGAHVHATLALVEQQRIANLIALAGLEMNGPLRHLAIQPDGPYSVDVKPDIAAALGLTAEQEGETA